MSKITSRGLKKAAVTRLITKISCAISEKNKDDVKTNIENVKSAFKEMETIHDEIIDDATKEEDLDAVEKAAEYLEDIVVTYSHCLDGANLFLDGPNIKIEEPNLTDTDPLKLSQLLTLPKIELPKYSGDILNYHSFIAVFNRTINNISISDDDKLTHLYDSTRGRAREAIEMCMIKGGTEGYQQALKNLKTRFGDKHLLAVRLKHDLCDYKPVKSANDLRCLADQAANANHVLKSTELYEEIDTQNTISLIVNRLGHHRLYLLHTTSAYQ